MNNVLKNSVGVSSSSRLDYSRSLAVKNQPKSSAMMLRRSVAVFGMMVAFSGVSQAASSTWTGGAGNGLWTDAGNWTNGVPGDTSGTTSPDIATFGDTGVTPVTVDANRNVAGIDFANTTAAGYVLSGGSIILSNAGTIQTSLGGSNHTDAVNSPVILAGDASFLTNSTNVARILSFGSTVTASASTGVTNTLTLAGVGNSFSNNIVNAITNGGNGGTLAVVKSDNGSWVFNSNLNTFSGGLTINAGTMRTTLSGNTTTLFGTGTITMAGGNLNLGATTSTNVNNALIVNAGTSFMTFRSNHLLNPATMTGTGTLTVTNSNSAGTVVTTSNLQNFGGTLDFAPNGANATTLRIATGANQTSLQNLTLNLRANTFLSQQGSAGTNGTVNVLVGALSGAGSVGGSGASSGTFFYNIGNKGVDTTFSGSIVDGASRTGVTKVGAGILTLSGANTYTNATTVTAGTLALGAADRIADVSTLNLNGGTFNTGGNNETLAALNLTDATTSNLDLGNGASVLNFSGFGAGTGTVNVLNYTAGSDRIFVGGTVTPAQLAQITFVNPNGTSSNATASLGAGSEIIPTPAAPSGQTAYAVVGSQLYSFNTSAPGSAVAVGSALPFAPEGIDFNPATGTLFALEVGPTNSQLYTIDTTTGVTATVGGTFLSAGSGLGGATGTTSSTYDLTGGQNIGFDFNPKTLQGDGAGIRIRVTSQNGSDIRLNSLSGAVAAVDPRLNGAATSSVGSAYTNNIAQQGGATTLYNVSENGSLYTQNPANAGTQVLTGPTGVIIQPATGFDIFTDASGANSAFLATDATAGAPSEFFTLDLANGTATPAGSFPAGLIVDDIAIQPLTAGAGAPLVRTITRGADQNNPATGQSVSFTVTFTEAVTGVNAADFLITSNVSGGSTTGAVITSVTGSGSVYTVVVGGFSGSGSLRLDVADNDSIVDASSTPLGGAGTTAGAGGGSFNTGEVITIAPGAPSSVVISEFRFTGPSGSDDEYVEIANTTGASINIGGYVLRTSTGSGITQDATVPTGTTLPPFGRFLFTGGAYSLGAYSNFGNTPAQTTASIGVDATQDSGAALLNGATVLDEVGFASSLAQLRDNGPLTGAPTSGGTLTSQHAFMRDFVNGKIKDTDNNTADFVLLATDGVAVPGTNSATIPAQLGAPNPESLSSPVNVNSQVVITLLQPEAGLNNAPNRLRTGSGNGGTLLLRRTIRNTGSQPLSRVRLLMTRITSQGSPTGIVPGTQADVRLISSGNESIALPNRDTNGVIIPAGQDGAGTTLTPVYAALLEAPSNATSTSGTPVVTGGGGGLGSSVVFDLTFPTPLLPNTSANYGFNLQVATGGTYLVAFNVLAVTQAPAN